MEQNGLGERILGFCDFYLLLRKYPKDYAFTVNDVNFSISGIRFVGLKSMIDPPLSSGTPWESKRRLPGDHPITAKAIA